MHVHKAIAVVAAIALTLAACGGDDDEGADEAPESNGRPTALMINPIHDAQVVRGDDGMEHVEYQLLVTSVFSEPVTMASVVVLGTDGKELQRIEGDALAATTQTLLDKKPSAVVPASGVVAIGVDLVVAPGAVPERVTHKITYTLEKDSTLAAMIDVPEIDGPEVAIDRSAAITVKPPLQGDGWVATTACCTPNVHRDLRIAVDGRRIDTAETFAVDWALSKGDRLYDGGGTQNEQFYDFGADVHAVADGKVVFIQEGKPEQDPTKAMVPADVSDYGGNQVMMELAPNVYAWYAHLQPGSLKVQAGDEVKAGTILAKLGNTGPSLGPHLHFGLLDRPDATTGRGLPFVLEGYTLTGRADLAASTGDQLVITPESRQIRDAYPLAGGIQNLP